MGKGQGGDVDTTPRATGDRMTTAGDRGPGYRREENVLGGVAELQPAEQFHVIGFDIGSAVLTPTMQADLSRIATYLRTRDDAYYAIVISGTSSESRIQRLDPNALALARAEAVRVFLVDKGIHAPMLTFSHGVIGAPPATSRPEVKAEWRAVIIDVKYSGITRRPPPKLNVPQPVSTPERGPAGMKILVPPTKYKDIPKKVKEVAEYFRKLNQSASDRVFHDAFGRGWAQGLARLTDADPAVRSPETFVRLPSVDLGQLTKTRLQAISDPVSASRRLDAVRQAGMRYAYDQVRALGPDAYFDYAAAMRARFADLAAREQFYFSRSQEDRWEL
jgi:hypothetical protein